MGTQERTKRLQAEIWELLAELGWSLSRLAEVVEVARSDDWACEEGNGSLAALRETIKKQLSRATTSPALLEEYLQIIRSDREYQKLAKVRQDYVSLGVLGDAAEEQVKRVSKRVAEKVKSRPDEYYD